MRRSEGLGSSGWHATYLGIDLPPLPRISDVSNHASNHHGYEGDQHADHEMQTSHRRAPKNHRGHDQHEGHTPQMFRDRFWLSLVLTVPVVFWSAHIQELLGYRAPEFLGSIWIPAVLGTAVFLYGGLVFLKGALRELRARLPGMMTLISLAISVAFVFSWAVELGLIDAEALWWELSTLVTIMLLGYCRPELLSWYHPARNWVSRLVTAWSRRV